jgi:hypothetical protein
MSNAPLLQNRKERIMLRFVGSAKSYFESGSHIEHDFSEHQQESKEPSFKLERINNQEVCIVRLPYLDAWKEGSTWMAWLRKGHRKPILRSGICLVAVSDAGVRIN